MVKPLGRRSFEVANEAGKLYTRNRRHLRFATKSTHSQPPHYKHNVDNLARGHDHSQVESLAKEDAPVIVTEGQEAEQQSSNPISDTVQPELSVDEGKPLTTRSGRVIKKPARYTDL